MNDNNKPGHGPIYGVQLIDRLPIDDGDPPMMQAMPSHDDLRFVRALHVTNPNYPGERVVAGYEVLLMNYQELVKAAELVIAALEKDFSESGAILWATPGESAYECLVNAIDPKRLSVDEGGADED
jgi:hypothetical protein